MKTITITVDTDGSVEIDAQGFSGSECKDATKQIEDALGVKTSEKKKAEFYRTTRRKINVRH